MISERGQCGQSKQRLTLIGHMARRVIDEFGFDGPALVEAFNADVQAFAPEEHVAAASLESVWP